MKRFSKDFGGGSSEKRAKFNGDDLWGDSDPDIDDFLIQASQTIEQIPAVEAQQVPAEIQQNDSVLSYRGFNKTLVSSTQFNASIWAHPGATTSKFIKQCKEYEEVQQLKEQINSKEGEISILRAQLKQTKEQTENTYAKQLNETLDRLKVTQKERDTFSTKLEFKDLEIVNLRKKLANVTKNLFDTSSFNGVNGENSVIIPDTSRVTTNCCVEIRIEPVTSIKNPLQSVIPVKIFESKENDKFPKVLHSKQLTDERYLHSLVCPNLQAQALECHAVFTYIRYGKSLRLQHFFDEIRFLQTAHDSQLLQETRASSQIYLLTLTLLINQLKYLAKFVKSVKTDEIREFDLQNLQYPNRNVLSDIPLMEPTTCDNSIEECAIQSRQCVALLAAIYPHNRYLRNLMSNSKLPEVTERERKAWVYSFPDIYSSDNVHRCCLKLLHQIVLYIGDTRRGNVYIGFLCSICYLLTQIIQFTANDDKIIEQICKLVIEIILTTPSHPVLFHLSEVFKHGSTRPAFVQQLCRNRKSNVQRKNKKGIMLINEKCCIIEMYFSLCRESLAHICHENIDDFRMHLNLVQFVANSIDCNVRWMYFEPDSTHFDCQKEYYKLTIDVIHASLLKCRMMKTKANKIPIDVETIVRIAPRVLGVLFTKYGELIEFNTQYNAIFKTSLVFLKDLQDKFVDWNQFEVETVTKHATCDSPPPLPTIWDNLSVESLAIDV